MLNPFSRVLLFATPWTVARQAPLSMVFCSKNTGVGCHALLQGIFLTQGSNSCLLHLLHWQVGSSPRAREALFFRILHLCLPLHFLYSCLQFPIRQKLDIHHFFLIHILPSCSYCLPLQVLVPYSLCFNFFITHFFPTVSHTLNTAIIFPISREIILILGHIFVFFKIFHINFQCLISSFNSIIYLFIISPTYFVLIIWQF